MRPSLDPRLLDDLAGRYGTLRPLSGGEWSVAMRGELDGRDVVVRVSEHFGDFEADRDVAALDVEGLLAPAVLELRRLDLPHDHLHVCVTEFCPGAPLEQATTDAWRTLVPRLADVLDAMRAISAPRDAMPWPDVLTGAAPSEDADPRLAGYRARLDRLPEQRAAHTIAMARLEALGHEPEVAGIERGLVHADLLHANVHVQGDQITGVFDWGCKRWGDPLYDLAWFLFWEPWHSNLDAQLLHDHLATRWGAPPANRIDACLLHIGADHLVYNAAQDDPAAGADVLARMRELALV